MSYDQFRKLQWVVWNCNVGKQVLRSVLLAWFIMFLRSCNIEERACVYYDSQCNSAFRVSPKTLHQIHRNDIATYYTRHWTMRYQHSLRSSVSFAIQDTISGLVRLKICSNLFCKCRYDEIYNIETTLLQQRLQIFLETYIAMCCCNY